MTAASSVSRKSCKGMRQMHCSQSHARDALTPGRLVHTYDEKDYTRWRGVRKGWVQRDVAQLRAGLRSYVRPRTRRCLTLDSLGTEKRFFAMVDARSWRVVRLAAERWEPCLRECRPT